MRRRGRQADATLSRPTPRTRPPGRVPRSPHSRIGAATRAWLTGRRRRRRVPPMSATCGGTRRRGLVRAWLDRRPSTRRRWRSGTATDRTARRSQLGLASAARVSPRARYTKPVSSRPTQTSPSALSRSIPAVPLSTHFRCAAGVDPHRAHRSQCSSFESKHPATGRGKGLTTQKKTTCPSRIFNAASMNRRHLARQQQFRPRRARLRQHPAGVFRCRSASFAEHVHLRGGQGDVEARQVGV